MSFINWRQIEQASQFSKIPLKRGKTYNQILEKNLTCEVAQEMALNILP